jgi:hypothetical protein
VIGKLTAGIEKARGRSVILGLPDGQGWSFRRLVA